MGIQDIIEGKRQWRAHMARVKALPPDYQVVYKEIQKYLFKVGPGEISDGHLLSGIVDFFEEGVAAGTGVLQLIGTDVAAFCDDLVKGSRARPARDVTPASGPEGPSHLVVGRGWSRRLAAAPRRTRVDHSSNISHSRYALYEF